MHSIVKYIYNMCVRIYVQGNYSEHEHAHTHEHEHEHENGMNTNNNTNMNICKLGENVRTVHEREHQRQHQQ
jgi:hypothetical protein